MPIRPPNNRIALIYGYVVCLCSLGFMILGLNLSLPNLVRLMSFNAASYSSGSSFQEFKDMHVERRIRLARLLRGGRVERPQSVDELSALERAQLSGAAPDSVTYVPLKVSDVTVLPDSALRTEYQETQLTSIAGHKYGLEADLIAGLQMALVAAVVFFLHWRWLQGFGDASARVSASTVPVEVETTSLPS